MKKLPGATYNTVKKYYKIKSRGEIDAIIDYANGDTSEPKTEETEITAKEFDEIKEERGRKQLLKDGEVKLKDRKVKLGEVVYDPIKLTGFGWINCDFFWKENAPKGDVLLIVKNDSIDVAHLFAVFKDVKSVMEGYYICGDDQPSFSNIPVGSAIKIIGVAQPDTQLYFFEKEITMSQQEKINVTFKPATREEIISLMKDID